MNALLLCCLSLLGSPLPADPRGGFTLDYALATADNRLIYYKDYDADGAVLLRTVKYTYYKLGHASNVTVKDEGDPWHYNVNLYYFSNGQLWRAVWDKWKIDAGSGLVDDYAVLDNNATDANAQYYPREFYYDGNGAGRLTRRMTVELTCCLDSIAGGETCWPDRHIPCRPDQLDDPGELPMTFKWKVARNGTFKHDFGADMLGLIPWSEFQAHLDDVNGNGRDDEDRIFPVASYLSDGRVQSRLPVGGNPEYLHGDLTHSTMLRTNPVGGAIPGTGGPGGGDGAAVLGYTAFGEPIVRNGGSGVPPTIGGRLPAAMHRYAYVGGLGYEQDTMILAGSTASPLPPITLSHVGQRWYQPGAGRWAQRDPMRAIAGPNLYAYCRNQPVNLLDPSGTFSVSEGATTAGIISTLGAGLLGGLFGGGSNMMNGSGTAGSNFGTGFLAGFVGGSTSLWLGPMAGGAVNGALGGLLDGDSWSAILMEGLAGGLFGGLGGLATGAGKGMEAVMIECVGNEFVNIGKGATR